MVLSMFVSPRGAEVVMVARMLRTNRQIGNRGIRKKWSMKRRTAEAEDEGFGRGHEDKYIGRYITLIKKKKKNSSYMHKEIQRDWMQSHK